MTLSLRARLLLGLVALVAVGLAVTDFVVFNQLQSFLVARVDSQLVQAQDPALHYFADQSEHHGPDAGQQPQQAPPPNLPPGTCLELRARNGALVSQKSFGFGSSASNARPVIPTPLPTSTPGARVFRSLEGQGGVSHFRAVFEMLPDGTGNSLVVSMPLTDVESTLSQLAILEALISAGVLLGLVAVAWWTIRIGLRPLERMGHVARAIADGDLSRRVAPAGQRTEIGRLGLALNGMLGQIEAAFDERTRSERRLRRFVGDASHELRTPLASIRGYAEVLRRGAAETPEQEAFVRDRIEKETIRMGLLVDDLLLLARLDQGRPLEQLPVDLRAIVSDACADAGAVAPDREITLTAPQTVTVTGDDARLRQVVANLLRNAIVHTPAATPVEVGLEAPDGFAVITVADHGPGLGGEQADRVFERFYRADEGRSRDSGGSGLGLSIVAAVVAAHRGRVEVGPTPGGGATFRIELPLAG